MLIKKTPEIKELKAGGKILGKVLKELSQMCQAGVSSKSIDEHAEKLILAAGGRPAFKNYRTHPTEPPFPATICASFNEEIVHGIPRRADILEDGDVFSIDIGMEWPVKKRGEQNSRGYFTDTALTVIVGEADKKIKKLLAVTKESLEIGIKAAQPGSSVADIGLAIEKYVKKQGRYGIVRSLTGHGVGHDVHEEPKVPNFYDPTMKNFILQPGMVIAIEPMITLGSPHVKIGEDNWTMITADKSICAHFEHTVVIGRRGNQVITRRPGEGREKI